MSCRLSPVSAQPEVSSKVRESSSRIGGVLPQLFKCTYSAAKREVSCPGQILLSESVGKVSSIFIVCEGALMNWFELKKKYCPQMPWVCTRSSWVNLCLPGQYGGTFIFLAFSRRKRGQPDACYGHALNVYCIETDEKMIRMVVIWMKKRVGIKR